MVDGLLEGRAMARGTLMASPTFLRQVAISLPFQPAGAGLKGLHHFLQANLCKAESVLET